MVSKLIVILSVAWTCVAGYYPPPPPPPPPMPQYAFGYEVTDTIHGDFKGHTEQRNGEIVSGSYSVMDPDGTRRIVHYTADPYNGFNAVVRRDPFYPPPPPPPPPPPVPPVPPRYAAAAAAAAAAMSPWPHPPPRPYPHRAPMYPHQPPPTYQHMPPRHPPAPYYHHQYY